MLDLLNEREPVCDVRTICDLEIHEEMFASRVGKGS
jgi:hypothetical protein